MGHRVKDVIRLYPEHFLSFAVNDANLIVDSFRPCEGQKLGGELTESGVAVPPPPLGSADIAIDVGRIEEETYVPRHVGKKVRGPPPRGGHVVCQVLEGDFFNRPDVDMNAVEAHTRGREGRKAPRTQSEASRGSSGGGIFCAARTVVAFPLNICLH